MNADKRMPNRRRDAGFTLIELLVVIGVIVILAALLIPMVIRSMRQSGKMRIQGDFQSIAVALEAYRTDFGDIPRVDPAFPDTGAAVLGKALLGRYGDHLLPNGSPDTADPITYQATLTYEPGDASWYSGKGWVTLFSATGVSPTASSAYWAEFDTRDGADGPGFRIRAGQGKIHGPYINPAKLNSRGMYLLDHLGGPILYFPTRPGQANVTQNNPTYGVYVDRDPRSYVHANDNFKVFRRLEPPPDSDQVVLARIRMILGDTNANGYIDSGEKAINQPYVLMSSGHNGLFGPAGYQPSGSPLNAAQAAEAKKLLERDDDVMNVQ